MYDFFLFDGGSLWHGELESPELTSARLLLVCCFVKFLTDRPVTVDAETEGATHSTFYPCTIILFYMIDVFSCFDMFYILIVCFGVLCFGLTFAFLHELLFFSFFYIRWIIDTRIRYCWKRRSRSVINSSSSNCSSIKYCWHYIEQRRK